MDRNRCKPYESVELFHQEYADFVITNVTQTPFLTWTSTLTLS